MTAMAGSEVFFQKYDVNGAQQLGRIVWDGKSVRAEPADSEFLQEVLTDPCTIRVGNELKLVTPKDGELFLEPPVQLPISVSARHGTAAGHRMTSTPSWRSAQHPRKQRKGKFRQFLLAQKKAIAKSVDTCVEEIRYAGLPHQSSVTKITTDHEGNVTTEVTERTERNWQALAWLPERRYPELFARRETQRIAAIEQENAAIRKELAALTERLKGKLARGTAAA
jgi:hypothetical protein